MARMIATAPQATNPGRRTNRLRGGLGDLKARRATATVQTSRLGKRSTAQAETTLGINSGDRGKGSNSAGRFVRIMKSPMVRAATRTVASAMVKVRRGGRTMGGDPPSIVVTPTDDCAASALATRGGPGWRRV